MAVIPSLRKRNKFLRGAAAPAKTARCRGRVSCVFGVFAAYVITEGGEINSTS